MLMQHGFGGVQHAFDGVNQHGIGGGQHGYGVDDKVTARVCWELTATFVLTNSVPCGKSMLFC